MAKVDFDEYADDYDSLLEDQLNFFSGDVDYYAKYKVDLVAEALKKEGVLKPSRILEFGCGTGRNLISFKKLFPDAELTGYDISKKSIDVAAATIDGAIFTSSLDELRDAHYDLVFVAGVYHHIEPHLRAGATEKIYRCMMNSNGRLFVFEHNPFNPVTRKMVRECKFDEDAVLLRSSELKKLLAKPGFKISYSKYTLFFPPNIVKNSQRWDKLFTWLPLGGQYFIAAQK